MAQQLEIPVPPDGIRVGKRSSYHKQGQAFLRLLVERCDLRPDSSVLEVGCGTGRIAAALAWYLSSGGRYEGFDIVADSVEWCQREIGSRFDNMRFDHADVFNALYNPDGSHPAAEYRFPYADDTFDAVYLTSIFTHMLPADVERYLEEIARTLRPGGRALITYFLLNEEARELIAAGRARPEYRGFGDRGDGFFAARGDNPEGAVAFEEDYVRGIYSQIGLEIDEPISYGRWCGRTAYLKNQDIVFATKR